MKYSIVAVLSLGAACVSGMSIPAVPIARAAKTGGWISVEDLSTAPARVNDKRNGPEITTCFKSGTKIDRAPAIAAIDEFCTRNSGRSVGPGQTVEFRFQLAGAQTLLLRGEAINGCSFVVDGNCNRLLRLPLDGCNTNGENGKQGGEVTDLCGQWRFDPGSDGSDD